MRGVGRPNSEARRTGLFLPGLPIQRNVRRIHSQRSEVLKGSQVVILVALLIILPGQALAYEDTGYDPADRDGDYPDIRTRTRSVWKNGDGVGFLRISFTGEEMLGVAAYWEMAVRLDTRGDGSFDVLMRFWDLDMSGTGCIAGREAQVIVSTAPSGFEHTAPHAG